ncbi:MAG TPA: universal stress protein UspA [Clostridia bacterium]|nr:universal stress protein UspA [Clostridia bacterium]
MNEKVNSCIMVCVTGQKSCDRLINRGIERSLNTIPIHVVHCVETGRNFLGSPYEADAIEYLFTAAQVAGAELNLLRADDVDDALVGYAKDNGVTLIVMGAASERKRNTGDDITMRLQRRLPDVEFDIVDGPQE